MSPPLTVIKLESIRANLRLASLVLNAQLSELALLDNSQTDKLGAAIETVDAVNLWVNQWQHQLEVRFFDKPDAPTAL